MTRRSATSSKTGRSSRCDRNEKEGRSQEVSFRLCDRFDRNEENGTEDQGRLEVRIRRRYDDDDDDGGPTTTMTTTRMREAGGEAGGWRVRQFVRLSDIPFELVGKVAGACTMTEAGHVQGGSTSARHDAVDGKKSSQMMQEPLSDEGKIKCNDGGGGG